MMPEWAGVLLAICGGLIVILIAVIGWFSSRKLDGIDKKLDRIEDRQAKSDENQAKLEKDCVTWADHEALKLVVNGVDRRVTVIETTCKQERGK